MNHNCSNLLDIRNLQEQVKKAFCYQKMFWLFTVWINCSNDLKTFSRSLEQFFNFGNKILFLHPWKSHEKNCRSHLTPRILTLTLDDISLPSKKRRKNSPLQRMMYPKFAKISTSSGMHSTLSDYQILQKNSPLNAEKF